MRSRREPRLERRELPKPQPILLAPDLHLTEAASLHLARALGLTMLIGVAGEMPRAEAGTAQLEQAFHYQSPLTEQLEAVVTPAELAVYYDVVNHFPHQVMLERLAEVTGSTPEQLQQQLDLQVVFPYVPGLADQVITSAGEHFTTPDLAEARDLRESLDSASVAGFTTYDDRGIGINLTLLTEAAESVVKLQGLPEEQYTRVLHDLMFAIVTHEFVHAVADHEHVGQPISNMIHEGLIHAIALEIIANDKPLNERLTAMPVTTTYERGQLQAARLIMLGLGEELVAYTVMSGDQSDLIKAFDQHYGADAWQQVMQGKVWSPNHQLDHNPILPLYHLLQTTYAEDGKQLVDQANRRWRHDTIIPVMVDDKCVGVALRQETTSNIAAGLVQLEVDDTTTLTYEIGSQSALTPVPWAGPVQHWYAADYLAAPPWNTSDRKTKQLVQERLDQVIEVVSKQ